MSPDRPTRILEMRAGSDLFGTRTEKSDTDTITVQFPPARDLLLSRVRDVDPQSTSPRGQRNRPEDQDNLVYTLAGFLRPEIVLSPRGQEVLFAPESVYLAEPSPTWQRLIEGRRHLVTTSVTSAVRYMQHQADHYGIAGSRPDAAYRALGAIQKMTGPLDGRDSMRGSLPRAAEMLQGIPHVSWDQDVGVLTVAGRRFSSSNSAGQVLEQARNLAASYTRWCRDGQRGTDVDWKALSHAVRVGHQTKALLATGGISLPLDRSFAEYIVAIKSGRVHVLPVLEEIESLIEVLPTLSHHPSLRPRLDEAWIEDFIVNEYGRYVGSHFA